MADYYAVLKRTLSGFGEPSESLRTKIYDKARVTIARQLDATQPPLADDVKAAQLAQLDEAIVRMEAEYAPPADAFLGDPPPLPPGTVAGPSGVEPRAEAAPETAIAPEGDTLPPPAEVAPEPEPPAVDEPAPAPEPPTFEAPPEPEPAPEPEPGPTPDAGVQPEAVPTFEPDEPSPDPVRSEQPQVEPVTSTSADPIGEAFAAIEAARDPDAAGATAVPDVDPIAPTPVETEAAAAEPALAAPVPVTFDPAAFDEAARNEADRAAASGATAASDDIFDDSETRERDAAALAAAPATVRQPATRGGRGVLWFLLLVALAGLLFVFRAPLLGAVGLEPASVDRFVASIPGVGPLLVGEVDDPNDPTRPKPVPTIRITPPAEEPVVEEGKREERLGPDGQETGTAETALPPPVEDGATPDSAAEDGAQTEPETALPAPTVPSDEAPAETETTTEIVPITPDASTVDPAAPETVSPGTTTPDAGTPEADAATDVTPAAPEPATGEVPVAQSAILYEEGSGTRETRSDRGAVVWSIVQQSPGNAEPAEPAIRAVLDVPERELKATITLRRNTDLALAASHLMEVNFEPAPGFSGQNIDDLLSVRMKPNEASQGTPLAVVPAKIAPGYFYVALDNLPSARERNLELLRSSRWIDIPVEYVTGRRAMVSLEKGVVGERVFAEALAAWDAAAAQ